MMQMTRRKIRRLRKRTANVQLVRNSSSSWSVLTMVLLLLSIIVVLDFCTATSIKWSPADDTPNGSGDRGKPNAATAPKSQRYWDEHGIERPDYAKTDAEVARERAAKYRDRIVTSAETTGGKVVLGVTIAMLMYAYLVRAGKIVAFWDKGSFRLGGRARGKVGAGYTSSIVSPSLAIATSRKEEARNARLARFDKKHE